jgi:dipeptide/tripeptide permease
MAFGSGCLKNNLYAFGGGQHKLPEQKKQLENFFSIQLFGSKTGSLVARIFFPVMRADAKCFGDNDCYSLSFGVASLILFLALVVFLLGTFQYIHPEPNGNMLLKVCRCAKVNISIFNIFFKK